MVDSVKGISVINSVKWQDDLKSRKRMFNNIRRYKKAVSSIDTLKLKMSGITETKNKIKDLKKEVQSVKKALGADISDVRVTSEFGPRRPPAELARQQADTKAQAETLKENTARQKEANDRQKAFSTALKEEDMRIDKEASSKKAERMKSEAAEQKRLDAWLSDSNKQAIKEEENLRKQNAAKRKARIQSIRSLKKEEQTQAVKAMRAENKEAARLSKIYAFELSPLVQDLNKERREAILLELRQIKNAHKLKDVMNEHNSVLRRESAIHKENLRLQNKQNFAQQRLTGSLKQMAGAAFSVYTAMQGIGAVARTGMGMQRIRSSMLAVSDNSADAKENIAFVRAETLRLGGDLVQNSKALSQLLANRGGITKEDTKALFTGIAELSTARGLTTDEVAGAVKAIGQMMGKFSCSSDLKRGKPTWSVQTSYGNLPC